MTPLDAALSAAGRGWRVFPLVAGRKTPRRALSDWEAKATSDPARIERWWTGHRADNVGIATGPSGLVVVDLDIAHPGDTPPEQWPDATSGAEVLAELAAHHHAQLPATWTVATPSGGRHLYYRAAAGPELRNTAGRAGWKIDTRAGGGYVVAAGSVIDRRPYRVTDDTEPVELPAWLSQLLTPPPPAETPRPAERLPRRRDYVHAALVGEVQRVLDAPPGTRNAALNQAAWSLARLVAGGLVPRHVVENALQAAGERAGGQTPGGVASTVRAAINARLTRPAGGS